MGLLLSVLYGVIIASAGVGFVLIGSGPAPEEVVGWDGAATIPASLSETPEPPRTIVELVPAPVPFEASVLDAFATLHIDSPVVEYVALAQSVDPEPEPPVVASTAAPVQSVADSCPAVIIEAFATIGAVWEGCVISFCESGWNPNAVGDNGDSLGLLQIQPKHHQAKADALFGSGASLLDPRVNAYVGVAIYHSWGGWGAWTESAALYSGGQCTHGAVYPG